MAGTVKLKDIYLGVPDGATEAQNEKFQELFYDPNNKYDELMKSNEKFLVVGSKGTGKTYLANYIIAKSPKNRMSEIVDANNFSLYKLSNLYDMELSNDLIRALCKWFLLDNISQLLLKRHILKSRFPFFKLGKLRKFVDQYDNISFFKDIKKIDTDSKESGFVKEKRAVTDIKSNSSALNFGFAKGMSIEAERKQFYELINSYEKLVLQSFSKSDDVLLIIDDLDEVEKDREKAGDIIITLINVVKEYNLKNKKIKGTLKIILLLRSDILSELQAKNANLSKIKTSCSVELYWLFDSMSEQYNHPLISMVLHKVKASCPEYRDMDNKKLFNELFPENIDNKRPLDYLLDYGFGRPRDIILYLNHTKREFPEDTCFSAVALKEARKLYSSDFYDEMLNQAAFHQSPKYVKQCLGLLASVKKSSFYYAKIQDIYTKNKDKYPEILNLDDALTFLYKIGAIGNVWRIDKGSKAHTCWSYKKDAMDEVDLSKKFTIHYGLRKKFSL